MGRVRRPPLPSAEDFARNPELKAPLWERAQSNQLPGESPSAVSGQSGAGMLVRRMNVSIEWGECVSFPRHPVLVTIHRGADQGGNGTEKESKAGETLVAHEELVTGIHGKPAETERTELPSDLEPSRDCAVSTLAPQSLAQNDSVMRLCLPS